MILTHTDLKFVFRAFTTAKLIWSCLPESNHCSMNTEHKNVNNFIQKHKYTHKHIQTYTHHFDLISTIIIDTTKH